MSLSSHDIRQPSARSDRDLIRAAFIPLLDAAVLIVAAEKGFAAAEGLDLQLTR